MNNENTQNLFNLTQKLVLASSSEGRKMLLKRLKLPFETASPDINEEPIAHETAKDLSLRLAKEKAQAISKSHKEHWIIASDQVAECHGKFLSKPLSEAKAVEQLSFQSGKTVSFFTSLALLNSKTGDIQKDVAINTVHFRNLQKQEIENYVKIDQPLHCAGSFKSESLGVSLFERTTGEDPNAIIGLPMILLCNFLRNAEKL